MGWIIWVSFFMLLLFSYWDQWKTLDFNEWLQIFLLFMLCNFYVNLFGLLIPAGFIIGLIYMNKKRRFYLAKALIFGLICVITNFYMPNFGLNEVKQYQLDAKYSAEFNNVNAIYHFNDNSEINALNKKAAELIKEKSPTTQTSIEDPKILFRIWALAHRNISIPDIDWLWSKAPYELHFYWSANRPNQLNDRQYVIFREVGYMGVFKRPDANSPFTLEAIYEFDRLKSGIPNIP
ncbi:hypothetical protein EHS13_31505 [Paenibacillus psychroresistens]|uniref:Uncharacterized protein n=1 Tax=Paenibacillus psychroresistens TaxID=1778678 RepID=A0A6B8RTF6_9BACL|nr:hypothetical protein [Paenibacillus psychroresistens]QGQ99084.1 hypothetical protein EHS13_31505 [Paenibacillus psychroresistens]